MTLLVVLNVIVREIGRGKQDNCQSGARFRTTLRCSVSNHAQVLGFEPRSGARFRTTQTKCLPHDIIQPMGAVLTILNDDYDFSSVTQKITLAAALVGFRK